MRWAEQLMRLRLPAGALALLLLVGCGERGDQGRGKVKLVLATGAQEALRPVFYTAIEEFEAEHPNVEIQLLEIPGKYYQKVLVMIAGRNAPDLMWMGQSFAEFATRGAFMDLSERIAAEIDVTEYHPKVLGWYRLDGKQIGIPYGIDTEFVAYNKTLFDEAGVTYPQDGWTIDEFVQKARKLTLDRDGDGRIDQYGYRGRINHATFGAAIISDDGMRALCNSPEMVESLDFNLRLIHEWKVSPRPEETRQEGTDNYSVFRQGKAAMMQFYTWSITHMRERLADVDWDIVGMPKARRRAHWASSAAYLVSADTKHPDEAWLFFKKLLSDEFQLAMSIESLPANLRVARKLVEENIQKPANLNAVLEATNHLYPTPRVPHLQELLAQFYLASEKVTAFYGTPKFVPPAQAMIEAEKRINQTIARRRRP